MFDLVIPITKVAMGALQFVKYFLNALPHFISHQPSEVVCIFITLILQIRLSVMDMKSIAYSDKWQSLDMNSDALSSKFHCIPFLLKPCMQISF